MALQWKSLLTLLHDPIGSWFSWCAFDAGVHTEQFDSFFWYLGSSFPLGKKGRYPFEDEILAVCYEKGLVLLFRYPFDGFQGEFPRWVHPDNCVCRPSSSIYPTMTLCCYDEHVSLLQSVLTFRTYFLSSTSMTKKLIPCPSV